MKLYKTFPCSCLEAGFHGTMNGVWVVECSYEERTIPKAAGFWWHPGRDKCGRPRCAACSAGVGAQWWTRDRVTAARLASYADGDVKADLEGVHQSQAASRAVDAEVDAPKPAGLEYLPFQRAGIAYAMSRPGVLIADEMGLGKTIQALGVINADPSVKKVLAIVPATLLLNWKREAAKWLVRPMKLQVIKGRELPDDDADFVVANYEKFVGSRGKALHDWCMARSWDLLLVDEAHYLKTPAAQRTKLILGKRGRKGEQSETGLVLKARRKLFLTGTPILNKPVEIFGLLNTLAPETFQDFFPFVKRYCGAYQGKFGWDFSGATNLPELQEKMRAVCMVRRLKKEVLKDLPPKRRQIIVLPADSAKREIEAEEEIFAKVEEELFAAQAAADLAHAAGDEEVYKDAVKKLRKVQGVALSAMSKVRHDTAVAKIPAVIAHVDGLLAEDLDKVIVYAHHHDVLNSLQKHFGAACVMIMGETPMDSRQEIVDRFQTDPSVKVFLGSITAAGVGITLTAASTVIFAELDWVPGNVTQAEDRAHRIGQTESVLVQHLVLDGSLDARMAERIVEKQEVMDKALDLPFERDLPAIGSAAAKPKTYPPATDAQRAAALEGLQRVAGVCDYASEHDGAGFNKLDAMVGHRLAALSTLTDGQVWLARKILAKYHGQIGEELLRRMG